jgi:hypothetical protein
MRKLFLCAAIAVLFGAPGSVPAAEASGWVHNCPPGYVWVLRGYYWAGCVRYGAASMGQVGPAQTLWGGPQYPPKPHPLTAPLLPRRLR